MTKTNGFPTDAELQKYFNTCQNCNADVKDFVKDKGYIYDTWEDKKVKFCRVCRDEVMDKLNEKYFVEECDGIGIYKHENQYYFGLFSGMSVNNLEDARLTVRELINKKLR